MAKLTVSDWDIVAANNTDINSIPIDGAVTTPSQVDDIVREMMSQIKTFSLFTSLTMESTDAGATAGPTLTLYRNSASPLASDIIGKVLFQGEDSAGNTEDYSEIYTQITDPTSASEDASILFRHKVAGTMTTRATMAAAGTIFAGTLTASGGGSLTGTWSDLGTVTTVDLNGGTVDGAVIGGTTPAAGSFTTLTTTGNATFSGDISVSGGDITAIRIQSFGGNALVLGSDSASVFLRPNGIASSVGQFFVGTTGAITGAGDFTTTGDVVTSGGDVLVGVAALINPSNAEYGVSAANDGLLTASRLGDVPFRVKRSNDGTLAAWYSGTTNEGVVSVSGGTVTYGAFCGAHWSQWAGEPSEVLRGTVLDTVDELCAWDDSQSAEILPRVKVSDTVGSRRVYGVYSHPDSDGSGDFHVASLGAYVVRVIGPVENGDLLESAGGGCARVQESEVFTSRTVAKVTSDAVIETYPDGSYLVPCTLHCG